MKKISIILLAIIAIGIFSSCKNEKEVVGNPKDYIDDMKAGLLLEMREPAEEVDSLAVDTVAEAANAEIE